MIEICCFLTLPSLRMQFLVSLQSLAIATSHVDHAMSLTQVIQSTYMCSYIQELFFLFLHAQAIVWNRLAFTYLSCDENEICTCSVGNWPKQTPCLFLITQSFVSEYRTPHCSIDDPVEGGWNHPSHVVDSHSRISPNLHI